MKNTKTFILMTVFTICSLLVAGVVKAEDLPLKFNSPQIVCTPDHIEKGEKSTCYYFGGIASGNLAVNGFVSEIYTSDDLVLDKMEAENSSIAEATLVKPGKKASDAGVTKNKYVLGAAGGGEAGKAEFQCDMTWYDLSETKLTATGADSSKQLITTDNVKDSSCGIYYSATADSAGAFTAQALKTADKHPDAFPDETKRKDFVIMGKYVVKLSDDTTAEPGSHCGDLCIKTWAIPDGVYYNDAKKCQAGEGEGCTPTNATPPSSKCTEIHVKAKGGEETPTGAFASYAILAAAAFIAICAVAIAKKNNKLYKI